MKKAILIFLFFIITSYAISHNIDSGLVAYYPFNGNANDESGNNHNGTVHNVVPSPDRFNIPNKSYYFNGNNSYIEILNSSNIHLQTGFSLCSWFKLSEGNGDNLILSKHLYGYRSGFGIGTFGNKMRFYVDSGYTFNGLNTNESYNDNQWHFMVGVFSGSSQNLYIDGILKNNQGAAYHLINNSNITIGNSTSYYGGYTGYYKGYADDIRIYNRVLSIIEINQIYILNGITLINSEIPLKYNLHQNYPNPFNPTTNIKFDLPNSTFIKLIIYDVLGREIELLINEKLKEGSYQVDWNASQYPSGVYFYKLETEEYSDVKKIIFLK